MKFQRTYSMAIEGQQATHIVEYPLTLDFDIERNTLASANRARFTVRNLKESTRRDIFHDRYDTLNYKRCSLQAGYFTYPTLPTIFQGNLVVAGSRREGVDWVTELECFDGGFGQINGQAALSLPAGYRFQDLIRTLIGAMPNVTPGGVGGTDVGPSARGFTFVGNSWSKIQQLNGDGLSFVDNEVANVMLENQYISPPGAIQLITSASGLLGTPRRQQALIECDILFEPRAYVGQVVQLKSLETINNGTYQVRGVRHRGRISGAFDGGAVTTLSLWVGTSRLNQVAA